MFKKVTTIFYYFGGIILSVLKRLQHLLMNNLDIKQMMKKIELWGYGLKVKEDELKFKYKKNKNVTNILSKIKILKN